MTQVDSRAAAPWTITTMEHHDRALEEVERAFAGRAEQEVVAALEQAIRSCAREPDGTGVRERGSSSDQ
ncbi:hypothetical protein [Geodermatophilus sp. URMC 62]|uniref:hypothetical protein n=1 Tax=Geodermatophilus sp. URMC 62 TaxID=3423414 RepID=UPI00406CE324